MAGGHGKCSIALSCLERPSFIWSAIRIIMCSGGWIPFLKRKATIIASNLSDSPEKLKSVIPIVHGSGSSRGLNARAGQKT